jgi:plasmid stabilization system protein ParE
MASRKIVWTSIAKIQLIDILKYFNSRNKSSFYSQKLNKKVQTELNILILQPHIGKKTDAINVRGLYIQNYIVFYEINEKHIIILSFWDTRQNPSKLKF